MGLKTRRCGRLQIRWPTAQIIGFQRSLTLATKWNQPEEFGSFLNITSSRLFLLYFSCVINWNHLN